MSDQTNDSTDDSEKPKADETINDSGESIEVSDKNDFDHGEKNGTGETDDLSNQSSEEAAPEEAAPEEAASEETASEEAAPEETASEEAAPEEAAPEETIQKEIETDDDSTESIEQADIVNLEKGKIVVEEALTEKLLTKLDNLSNPYEQQLKQAKNLILTLSGVTGIVMIVSITFFIVMSMSIAQKVDELDRVLMAVAKRGIQLADGIETIAEMEVKIQQVIEQNDQVNSNLGKLQSSLAQSSQDLKREEVNMKEAISEQNTNILNAQAAILKSLTGGVDEIEKLIEKSVKLKPLENAQSSLDMQVKDVNKILVAVEKKIQDLYVIKQAEMESVFKDLSRSE